MFAGLRSRDSIWEKDCDGEMDPGEDCMPDGDSIVDLSWPGADLIWFQVFFIICFACCWWWWWLGEVRCTSACGLLSRFPSTAAAKLLLLLSVTGGSMRFRSTRSTGGFSVNITSPPAAVRGSMTATLLIRKMGSCDPLIPGTWPIISDSRTRMIFDSQNLPITPWHVPRKTADPSSSSIFNPGPGIKWNFLSPSADLLDVHEVVARLPNDRLWPSPSVMRIVFSLVR